MSSDEKTVRRAFEAFARADLEAAHATLCPDVEIYDHDIPDAGEGYRGHSGFDRWIEEVMEGWGDMTIEIEDVVEPGGDRLVTMIRLMTRGRASGLELEREDGVVWAFRDGLISRIDYFNDRDRALRAAGVAR